MSYNAACTHARYHNARGRQLDQDRRTTRGSAARETPPPGVLAFAPQGRSQAPKSSQDYEVFPKKVLGEGCSGLVVMAKGRTDGRMYALKRIHKLKVQPKVLNLGNAEWRAFSFGLWDVRFHQKLGVEIYLMLDHPHIAALRDVYETDSEIALLTECCEGGELYSRLSSSGTYAEADAANATHQMLLAVGYLHAHHVVHRDLKLENFLYESSDPNSLLKSLGVIVFMLLVGYPPFHGSEKDMRANILCANVDWSHKSRWRKAADAGRSVCAGRRGVFDVAQTSHSQVSEDAVDFVKCLLVRDPLQRMDVGASLSHRWIKSRHSDGRPVLDKEGRTGSERRDAAEGGRAVTEEQVYYSDFLAATLDVRKQIRQEAVLSAFNRLDADGSGSISPEDLRQVIGETFEGVNVELLVREADAACKGELTFQDFLSLLDSTDASVSPKARQKAGIQASFYLQPNVVP
eukprot:g23381.t1